MGKAKEITVQAGQAGDSDAAGRFGGLLEPGLFSVRDVVMANVRGFADDQIEKFCFVRRGRCLGEVAQLKFKRQILPELPGWFAVMGLRLKSLRGLQYIRRCRTEQSGKK
jgi:hypothetical protein